jgi:hypothetical protein
VSDPSKESPQERVDYYVSRQVAQRRATGAEVDAEALRQGTVRLLQMADLERSYGAPTRSRRPEKDPSEVREAKRKLGPEALAEASGTEFYYRDERDEPLIEKPKPSAQAPRGLDGERHFALLRRIKTLMARIPGRTLKPGESLYANHVHPRFAQLLDMNTRYAALTDPNSQGLGKYAGLKVEDRQRRYYNQLERICSMSDAVIGQGWWVPK